MLNQWGNISFNELWNMKGNETDQEKMTIEQLQSRLLLQATELELMGERLKRIEDTCRYLMGFHYSQAGKE